MMAVHHSYKNGIECIWKQHVKLYEWSEGARGGLGWAEGGGGGAKSWASSIRQSSSSGMGAGTKDQSCVWLWGEGGAGQNTKCNLPGGRGVAITCSKEMHYQDYCRDDAQEQVAVRLRIMHCLPECLPTQYAPAGPFPPAACHHPSSVQLCSKFSKTTHQPLQAFIKPECASTQSISRCTLLGRFRIFSVLTCPHTAMV